MPFQISVQPSGRFFDAGSDETLLMAGLRQGIGLPYGCKDGACGSCKCKKLSGTVTHRAHQSKALSEEEEANGNEGGSIGEGSGNREEVKREESSDAQAEEKKDGTEEVLRKQG